MSDKDKPRTIKGLLLEMKLSPNYEERILAEEMILNEFEQSRAELAEKDKRIAELEAENSNCIGCQRQEALADALEDKLQSANAKLEKAKDALKFASIENASRREVAFCAAETLAEIEGDE